MSDFTTLSYFDTVTVEPATAEHPDMIILTLSRKFPRKSVSIFLDDEEACDLITTLARRHMV